MKAAIVHEQGGIPLYGEFRDPEPAAGEVLVRVLAVAVENVDRAVVAGTHFTAGPFLASLPAIPCFDGIGALPDGTVVGFGGLRPPFGALAEYVAVPATATRPIPEGLDPATASMLSSAITAMTMRTAGGLEAGETVLVQGATGVSGRLAVQIARLLGAGRVVATGRNEAALASLAAAGADSVINTAVSDDELVAAYRREVGGGFDVVVDFLWGRPTELLCRALTPDSFVLAKPTRLVQLGESAGASMRLEANAVRTSGLEIYGGAKNITTGMEQAYQQVVEWIRGGDLVMDLTRMPLSQIETAWQRTDLRGSRLVIVPD